jgi:hypothetical protein
MRIAPPRFSSTAALRKVSSPLIINPVRNYKASKAEIFGTIGVPPGGFVPAGLEKFNVNGLGSGFATVSRGAAKEANNQQVHTINFLVNADKFAKTPKVKTATMVIVRPNSGGIVEVPMEMAKDNARSWNRMVAKVNAQDLNTLRGGATEVEFVFKLKLTNGKTEWINQHGNPFQNFAVHKDQMLVGL